jgi:protein-tyrosine phosphatase
MRAPVRETGARRLAVTDCGVLTDIHCHLLPGLDDGPRSWDETLAMSEMAAADGIGTIVATPHQLGAYRENSPERIRDETARLQALLDQRDIPLRVLPGADVRVEPDLPAKVRRGEVLTLADRGRHLLLELPHEVYLPLDRLLDEMSGEGLVGILSHPERNEGVLRRPGILRPLVDAGCLVQVTAGSLTGLFGFRVQRLAESLILKGLVHCVSSDAHGTQGRTPLLGRAMTRAAELIGRPAAVELFCRNPARIASGRDAASRAQRSRAAAWGSWLPWKKAG